MYTYLITGGAGFIGSNFIHYILKKYNDIFIINLDKLTYAGNLENLRPVEKYRNYKFIKGDICDEKLIEDIFSSYDIDYIVNFAAESHVDRSIKDSTIFIKTNVLGTQTLLNVAKKYWQEPDGRYNLRKKFLQISTDEVYGSLDTEGYFRETTPLNPRNPYSASKASADLIVKSYYDTYGFPINITRCSNNYGPYQFPEKLIPLVINNCLKGKNIPVYGDGSNIRDWLYVKDHCKAIDIVLTKGQIGQIYNVGGNNEVTNIDMVKILIKLVRELLNENDKRKECINEQLIKFVEDRKGHDKRYAIDASKIKEELGWLPETTFEEGIKNTVKWYLDNGEWLKNITSGEYLRYYEEMYKERLD